MTRDIKVTNPAEKKTMSNPGKNELANVFSRDVPKGQEFKRVGKSLEEVLADVKVDRDPKVGQELWVATPSMLCQVDISTISKRARSDLLQNTKVYCAASVVWLDPPFHGTCRMPITMNDPRGDPGQGYGGKQPVYWVTYYDNAFVDKMKRYCLVPQEDELLYFRVWLSHKFGKMLQGSDGLADTSWWFKFYQELDTDNSNSVSMEEFQVGLAKYDYPSKSRDAADEKLAYDRRAALLTLLDENGDGELSFEEFGVVLNIDPKDVARKHEEFRDAQRIGEVMERQKSNTFVDEDVYVYDPVTGKKVYSSQKAYDRWIRHRDNRNRRRTNNEAQRHTREIYTNRDMHKLYKQFGQAQWRHAKDEKELWAKHPKVWCCRLRISPTDMHPNFRDYFGKPGLFNGEREINEQMERDAMPPEPRVPMSEELALLREHLCSLYSVPDLDDITTQKKIFDMIDDNGNGSLSVTEFTQALAHVVHYPPGPTTISHRNRRTRMFHAIDFNAEGELDFEKCRKGLFSGPVGLAQLEAFKKSKPGSRLRAHSVPADLPGSSSAAAEAEAERMLPASSSVGF